MKSPCHRITLVRHPAGIVRARWSTREDCEPLRYDKQTFFLIIFFIFKFNPYVNFFFQLDIFRYFRVFFFVFFFIYLFFFSFFYVFFFFVFRQDAVPFPLLKSTSWNRKENAFPFKFVSSSCIQIHVHFQILFSLVIFRSNKRFNSISVALQTNIDLILNFKYHFFCLSFIVRVLPFHLNFFLLLFCCIPIRHLFNEFFSFQKENWIYFVTF